MTWAEIERLTQQVQQIPPAQQQTSQQLSRVMVSAHSTMIEGSRVKVPEAMDFLLGEDPALGVGKPPEGYNMLDDHTFDLALAWAEAKQLPGFSAGIDRCCHAQRRPGYQYGPGHGRPRAK